MLDSLLSIEETQDAIAGTQSTRSEPVIRWVVGVQPPALVTKPQPPVLVTEQEVMFGTAAAVRPRSAIHRFSDFLKQCDWSGVIALAVLLLGGLATIALMVATGF